VKGSPLLSRTPEGLVGLDVFSLKAGAEANCSAQKGKIWKEREELGWRRLCTEMQSFPVTPNTQSSLLMS
jgi:hypothetical protein